MKDFQKIVRVGEVQVSRLLVSLYCKVELKTKDKGQTLSIVGVEGPMANGDARGSCGQIVDELAEIKTFAPGWDAEKRDRFAAIWKEWHLNDMTPGCEHQVGPEWKGRNIDAPTVKISYDKIRELEKAASKEELATFDVVVDRDHEESFARAAERCKATAILWDLEQAGISVIPKRIAQSRLDKLAEDPAMKEIIDGLIRAPSMGYTGHLNQAEHDEGFLGKPCQVCGYKWGHSWLFREIPADVLEFLAALPDTDKNPPWV